MSASNTTHVSCSSSPEKLPFIELLILSAFTFLTIVMELLPAGVLLQMEADLGQSASQIGLLISYYAMGSASAAIPFIAMTKKIARKPLLITVLLGFVVSNAVSAIADNYFLSVIARICAGILTGGFWTIIIGYSARIVHPAHSGRAVAIVMTGGTVAMSIGLPLAAFIGQYSGWRALFIVLALIILILTVFFAWKVRDVPNATTKNHLSLVKIVSLPGIFTIVAGSFIAAVGNYALYSYIAPLVLQYGLYGGTGFSLFLIGMGALLGVISTGKFIDQQLKFMLFLMLLLAFGSVLVVSLFHQFQLVVLVALFFWGLSFGGYPLLCQVALQRVAGEHAEAATSLLGTAYGIAIFTGAWIGGKVLDVAGISTLPWLECVIFALALIIMYLGRRNVFKENANENLRVE